MDYTTFHNTFKDYPVIIREFIQSCFPGFDYNNLTHWINKGYLIKLRNGYYVLSDYEPQYIEYEQFLSNYLYSPSYVSIEYALSIYGLIPEHIMVYLK